MTGQGYPVFLHSDASSEHEPDFLFAGEPDVKPDVKPDAEPDVEPDKEPSVGELRRQQSKLERAGRLHWIHWLIIALSIVVTLVAWIASNRALEQQIGRRFERQADRVVELFVERLDGYASLLRSGSGLMVASGTLTDAQWQRYAAALELNARFPAIVGLGVAYRVDSSTLPAFLAAQRERSPGFELSGIADGDIHLPLVHVTPRDLEETMLGMDLAGERRRLAALKEALARAEPRITAPLSLPDTQVPGFLMAAPFYHRADQNDTEIGPGDIIVGAAVASIRIADLVAGILDVDQRKVRVRLSDAGVMIHDGWAQAEAVNEGDETDDRRFLRSLDVPLYGRTWQFDIESTALFHRENANVEPLLILAGGLLIDVLLLGLFLVLSHANRRALVFASRIGDRLHGESARLRLVNKKLASSNRKLETFSYVVSHDLKAPLNGIAHLAEFLEEDFEEYRADPGPESGRDVAHHIERIRQRVTHARALIDGILDYSGLGSRDERAERVDTRRLVTDIVETLDPHSAEITLEGPFPVIETCATRLYQVLANLVGNAFKYHHDPARMHIAVRTEVIGERLHFSVSDDGPGIDPRFHEHVFELFGSLESNGGRSDSTGIGLSIARKTVETMGGTLRLDSEPGRGATFSFDWPTVVDGARCSDEIVGTTPEKCAGGALPDGDADALGRAA